MTIESLEWRTFAPLDLGARVSSPAAWRALETELVRFDWTTAPASKLSVAITGSDVRVFQHGTSKLHVPSSGFAVLELIGEEELFGSEREFLPWVHLERRRRRHRSLLAYEHPSLPPKLKTLAIRLREKLARQTPKHLRRLQDQRVLHYVMSVYFARTSATGVHDFTDTMRRSLRVCLEPGILNLDDTPYLLGQARAEDSATLEHRLAAVDPSLTSFGDFDRSERSMLLASWSSVFALGDVDDELIDMVCALQVRLQSSWLAAWTVGDLARRLVMDIERRHVSRRRMDWLTVELSHLRTGADRRVDASTSNRITEMDRSLRLTSGLAEEWAQASEALTHAREYATLVTSDANHRSQVAVEVLLLVFALSSFAPVVLRLPITSWPGVRAQQEPIILLLVILVLGTILIVRRKR